MTHRIALLLGAFLIFPGTGAMAMVFATHLVVHDWPNSEPLNNDLQELVLRKEADDVNNGITRSNAGGWQSAGNLITWKESCIETFCQRIE